MSPTCFPLLCHVYSLLLGRNVVLSGEPNNHLRRGMQLSLYYNVIKNKILASSVSTSSSPQTFRQAKRLTQKPPGWFLLSF